MVCLFSVSSEPLPCCSGYQAMMCLYRTDVQFNIQTKNKGSHNISRQTARRPSGTSYPCIAIKYLEPPLTTPVIITAFHVRILPWAVAANIKFGFGVCPCTYSVFSHTSFQHQTTFLPFPPQQRDPPLNQHVSLTNTFLCPSPTRRPQPLFDLQ